MTKVAAFGTVVAWDPAGGSSYTDIGQLRDIGPPGITRDSIEVTTHDSTDAWREFIKGIKDGGEFTMVVEYDPVLATHDYSTGLLSDFDEDVTIPNFRLTFPDATTTQWICPGFITNAQPATPLDSDLTMAITVKVSGKPTLA
jgi:predicted secreted protein